ncbi:unnamed protein product [Enterobius vermicularis]|uniref:Fungal_trans domain-containing protein n=1 Tax=Enterobius vermicularis TaxID=51028 RepID=A0A0N4VBP7_ENTVE|nr:unnamed protein product [Enterobius vermicularis]
MGRSTAAVGLLLQTFRGKEDIKGTHWAKRAFFYKIVKMLSKSDIGLCKPGTIDDEFVPLQRGFDDAEKWLAIYTFSFLLKKNAVLRTSGKYPSPYLLLANISLCYKLVINALAVHSDDSGRLQGNIDNFLSRPHWVRKGLLCLL